MKYHIKEKVKVPKLGLMKALEHKIQKTRYDRKLGKYVREEVTESDEQHKARTANWPKGPYKVPTEKEKSEHQKKFKRGYDE